MLVSSFTSRGVCTLAASLATIALAVPATAGATSKQKLISEAKLSMRVETRSEESSHLISYARTAKFTINCSFSGKRILCREYSGPDKCVNGKPWARLSDIFPVIKGRVGESLLGGLTVTDVYCH